MATHSGCSRSPLNAHGPAIFHACRLSQSGYAGRAHLFIVGLEEGRVFAGSTEDPVLLDEERARISEDLTRSTDRIDEAVYGVLSQLEVSGAHATFSYACRDTREFRETFVGDRDGHLQPLALLCGAALYGGTLHLITGELRRFEITARVLSFEELADVSRAIGPVTKLVWVESPANPTLRCVDIRQVADVCRARGVLSVIDNTFATPVRLEFPILSLNPGLRPRCRELKPRRRARERPPERVQ